jgi:hypothetical protein
MTGLILGLLSPLWVAHPLMWILPVPMLGVFFSALGLRRIARDSPAVIGRKAAIAGLCLSLLFGVAAVTNWLGYDWAVRREARTFAQQWFDLLAHNQPQKAYQLTLHPTFRLPLDDQLLRESYQTDPARQQEVDDYGSRPLIRALTALGDGARARYYETCYQDPEGKMDQVHQVYAVTYDDPQTGEKKSFFVLLQMRRHRLDGGWSNWQLWSTQGGFKPEGL